MTSILRPTLVFTPTVAEKSGAPAAPQQSRGRPGRLPGPPPQRWSGCVHIAVAHPLRCSTRFPASLGAWPCSLCCLGLPHRPHQPLQLDWAPCCSTPGGDSHLSIQMAPWASEVRQLFTACCHNDPCPWSSPHAHQGTLPGSFSHSLCVRAPELPIHFTTHVQRPEPSSSTHKLRKALCPIAPQATGHPGTICGSTVAHLTASTLDATPGPRSKETDTIHTQNQQHLGGWET